MPRKRTGFGSEALYHIKRQESRRELRELKVKPSKQKGQNFLVSGLVIDTIIDFGKPDKSEFLIEIGPGLGVLTEALVPYDLKAVIEIEPAFASAIKQKFPGVQLFQEDARNFDFSVFGQPISIFTNLPYSISSEMVLGMVNSKSGSIKRIVLMLQKEFVERLAAKVGSYEYGILSVFCQRSATIKTGPVVPADCFEPRPKIDSQLIELSFNNRVANDLPDFEKLFAKTVRAAFSKRRKTLSNSLFSSGLFTKEVVAKALEKAQIDPGARAQTLSWQDFERLTTSILFIK
jgi:16S rRNA (adenine1518-N6/adenine1519-N6)-dimethyltransferase